LCELLGFLLSQSFFFLRYSSAQLGLGFLRIPFGLAHGLLQVEAGVIERGLDALLLKQLSAPDAAHDEMRSLTSAGEKPTPRRW